MPFKQRLKKARDPSAQVLREMPEACLGGLAVTGMDRSTEAGFGNAMICPVQLTVRNRQRTLPFPDAWMRLIREAVAQCLRISSFPYPAVVHADIVGNRAMSKLNRQFRNRKGVTDVLSFPALHFRSGMPVFTPGDRDPETGAVFLGDIVICLPRMRLQADQLGHGMDRELGFLAVHGSLHLLGQDHETPEEERRMFGMQENALAAMGLSRPGGDR